MIKAILFDLDGTLLNMSTEYFVEKYYKLLARDFKDVKNCELFLKGFNIGYFDMRANDTDKTNDVIFVESLKKNYPDYTDEIYQDVSKFYQTSFNELADNLEDHSSARKMIKDLKEKGYKIVLATNPVFPRVATIQRLHWIGIDENDFELITTFENSSRSKPNPEYYKQISEKINVLPEHCLMIGNDVIEDLSAAKVGMKTYLVTDNLHNHSTEDYHYDYKSDLKELEKFVEKLPKLEE